MPTRKRAGPQGDHFSGFDRSLECLERISDIQRQTGKPISMPTAKVAIKESAKVSCLILSAWMLGPSPTCKNSPERWNGRLAKALPEMRRDRADTRRPSVVRAQQRGYSSKTFPN